MSFTILFEIEGGRSSLLFIKEYNQITTNIQAINRFKPESVQGLMQVSQQNDTFGPNCCSFKSKDLRLSGFRPVIFVKLRPNLLIYKEAYRKDV